MHSRYEARRFADYTCDCRILDDCLPRLAFAKTLEERLVVAAAVHSKESAIARVSSRPPTMRWRQIAKQREKRLVMIPLTRFSGQVIDRLRHFHVLNGHEIRSYAARFIR